MSGSVRLAWVATSALALGLLALPLSGHRDDSDDQLYRVVARHLVEDGRWIDTRYLPAVHPRFREHLPFGLWPVATAFRLAGESAGSVPGLLFALGTLAIVGFIGVREAGPGAGMLSVLLLALTETFWSVGGTARLDVPLLFFAWAAAAAVLADGAGRGRWAIAAAAGTAAVAIKGPFGLLPLLAAGGARALQTRRAAPFVRALGVAGLAVLPTAAFLLHDRWVGDGSWWRGYVEDQLLASARGGRSDGTGHFFLYPFAAVSGRFWPGLPFALAGGWLAFSDRPGRVPARTFLTLSLGVLLALCVPERKVWNHALVAFPALALLAGLGAASALRAAAWSETAWRRVGASVLVAAGVVWISIAAGLGGRLWPARCVAQGPFAAPLAPLVRDQAVAVVSETPHWKAIAALAWERRLAPIPLTTKEALAGSDAPVAFLDAALGAPPAGWVEVARAPGWTMIARR